MSITFQPDSVFATAAGAATPQPHLPRAWSRLAAGLGALLRGTGIRAPAVARRQRDRALGFAAVMARGDALMERSRREKTVLSVAVFDLSDLPELRSVFGRQAAREVVARVTTMFERIATAKGLVARTGPTLFTVLIPGLGRDRALATIREVMGHPCCIELEASRDEIVLIPEFMVQTVRSDTVSIAAVYEALCHAITQAREREQDRRRYLQREREWHTRPMGLRASAAEPGVPARTTTRRRAAPLPATIPAPLASLGA